MFGQYNVQKYFYSKLEILLNREITGQEQFSVVTLIRYNDREAAVKKIKNLKVLIFRRFN